MSSDSMSDIAEVAVDQSSEHQIAHLLQYLDRDDDLPAHDRLPQYSEDQTRYLVLILFDIHTYLSQNQSTDFSSFEQGSWFHSDICCRLAVIAISTRTLGWNDARSRKCEMVFKTCMPDLDFVFGVPLDDIDEYFGISLGWSRHEADEEEKIIAREYFQANVEVAEIFNISQDSHFYRDWKLCTQVASLVKERYNLHPTILQLIYIRRELLRHTIQIINGMEGTFLRFAGIEFGPENFPMQVDIMYTQMMAASVQPSSGVDNPETRLRWPVLLQIIRTDVRRDLMAGVARGPILNISLRLLDDLARVYQKALLAKMR